MEPTILKKVRLALEALIRQEALQQTSQDTNKIQLSFIAPNADFVAGLGAEPVINCYLIGVTEDKNRRKSEPYNINLNTDKTRTTLHREPRFVDITYMITVWSKDKQGSAEIEHLLIGYLISGLGKYDFLPDQYASKHQINPEPYGIRLTLFGSENSERISGHVWQAMGSTPKPSLMLSLSIPVDVHQPVKLPAVQAIQNSLRNK
ncbi:MAG: DUF4255 domain-containing protein [Pseudomonadota bacterium]